MSIKPTKKNQESESLKEQIVKLEKQLESFKYSNDHFLKNKLFLHYDIKEPEKVVVDCETKLPVLAEIDKKKIQKGKESDPTHLIIEGDNYHTLSVLNYTHAGKIDVIYIDPPYNTKSSYFIYNDKRVDREDSFTHSKWLSFMAHRLRLAKNLLAETGVIFISIDDNEQAHLRLLCDQIFREENFHGTLTWINKTKPVNSGKAKYQIQQNLEYIFVYSNKRAQDYDGFDLKLKGERKYPHSDKEGVYRLIDIKDSDRGRKKRDTMKFKILGVKPEIGKRWKIGESEINNLIRNDRIVKIEGKIKRKIYKHEESGFIENPFWSHLIDVATAEDGKKELSSIVGPDHGFDTVKPLSLIEDILSHFDKNISILDFFAGSGTTGHAVLNLNKEDGGNRQFILCTNNENGIAKNITYPRIKKVIDGYGDNAPSPANLRYFQTDFVEKKGSASQLKIDLTRQCAEMLCVKENVFEAVKLKKAAKNYKFFKNGDKYLCVFFDFFTDPEFMGFIKELNALPNEAEKAVYVFVLDGSAGILADEFSGVANCEVKEIPQKILDIYKQLAREVARK
jgi:adenine-specific DNA-methyltransferase